MTQLSTLQNYLRLFKRGELTEDQYKKLHPQNARFAQAQALSRIHTTFTMLTNVDQLLIRHTHVTIMLALI